MLAQIIQNNTYRIDHVVWRHCSAIAEVYDDLDFHYTGMHHPVHPVHIGRKRIQQAEIACKTF